MSGSVRCFLKLNLGLLSKNVTRHIVFNQARTLFTEQSLGLTAFLNTRNAYKNQFLNLEESFRAKMKNYVDNDPLSMIFTEDLKVMLHLAEKNPDDIDLVIKMLKKFNGQSSEMRFGTYSFGPVVMRSFHRLNEPDIALKLFKDPDFFMFFNQLSSYQIFMDLLYRNQRYKEMRDVYDIVRDKLTDGRVHPRNALILVTAACYKENSEESMKYALNLWRDLDKRGYPTVRRVLTHLGALALNQGHPHIALEILTTARKPRYIGIRCLKIMAFADLDRVDDIVPFFRSSLDVDDPSIRKETYFKDTIAKVEAAIERTKTPADSEVVKLLQLIKNNDMIQSETVDDHINGEVNVMPTGTAGQTRFRDYSKMSRNNNSEMDVSGPRYIRRPGLRDLV